MAKKGGRGGKREGSGRPVLDPGEAKVAYNTRLSQDVVAYLRSTDNAAGVLDQTVRRSKGYREWNAESARRSG